VKEEGGDGESKAPDDSLFVCFLVAAPAAWMMLIWHGFATTAR